MTDGQLISGAMAGGLDGLSPRDCWLCLAYLYSQGQSAQNQLNSAIAVGLDKLATGDIKKCLAYNLNP